MGGTRFHNQSFNAQGNKAMCSLLMLAAIALAMPTAARHMGGKGGLTQTACSKSRTPPPSSLSLCECPCPSYPIPYTLIVS